jgi:hypothetical protein
MKQLIFLITIAIAFPAFSRTSKENHRLCFKNETQLPEFLRTIAESNLSAKETLDATYFACVEVQDIETSEPGPVQDHARFAQKNWDFPVIGPMSVKFAEFFSGTDSLRLRDVRRDFAKKLKAIRSLENRYERIHQTYRLVNQYQGKYDRDSKLPLFSTNPKDTLERSSETSYGGVCRQFAELLKWSLNQVSQQGSSSINKTFTADIASSWDHMWVRVTLPSEDGSGSVEETIDLDNTDHPHLFVPLRSRTSLSENEQQAIDGQCRRLQACLREQVNATELWKD